MSDDAPILPQRLVRYFRQVIAFPDGAVVHDGDCHVFSWKICTCGLLHSLLPLDNPVQFFPQFYEQRAAQDTAINNLRDPLGNKQLPYPVSIVADVLAHAVFSEQAKHVTIGEVLKGLEIVFTPAEITQAREHLAKLGKPAPQG